MGEDKVILDNETNRKYHQETWLELARTGSNNKESVIYRLYKWKMIEANPMVRSYDCFACQEAYNRVPLELYPTYEGQKEEHYREYRRCTYCPLGDWGTGSQVGTPCETLGTTYRRWRFSENPLERKMLAMQIAFMKWR